VSYFPPSPKKDPEGWGLRIVTAIIAICLANHWLPPDATPIQAAYMGLYAGTGMMLAWWFLGLMDY
jgi:hypothetical protein